MIQRVLSMVDCREACGWIGTDTVCNRERPAKSARLEKASRADCGMYNSSEI